MSSSPSRALAQPPAGTDLVSEAQPFPYDALPAATLSGTSGHVSLIASEPASDQAGKEAAAHEAVVREQGRQQGLVESRKAFEDRLAAERSAISQAVAHFAGERAAYFQKVEAEVVQLALAIAKKILHREAQLDPLLLAGIVRVALEKISGATGVVLRVKPDAAQAWQQFFAANLKPSDVPKIVEDPRQPAGRCTLETAMGTTEIGVDVQLKEIEQGLMDLMAARPARQGGSTS